MQRGWALSKIVMRLSTFSRIRKLENKNIKYIYNVKCEVTYFIITLN